MQFPGKMIVDDTIDGDVKFTTAYRNTLIRTTGVNAFTANQSMGGFKLTNLGTPTVAGDAATKGYVDAVATGLDVKGSVRALANADIGGTYSPTGGTGGTGDFTGATIATIDGVTIADGDRILLTGQTDAKQNGIYLVTDASNGDLERSFDADSNLEVTAGMFTFVTEGTSFGDSGWVMTANDPVTLNTTNLTFTQFSDTGNIVAGAGLTRTGNTIDFVAGDNSLTVNANDVIVRRDPAGALGLSGSGIAVNVDGQSIEISSNAVQVKIHNTSLAKSASGLRAAVPYTGDKQKTPSATTNNTNFETTGLTITATPAAGSYPMVMVNGLQQWVAKDNTERATADCYFSGDGGTTARAFSAIVAGDTLYWNGANTNAKFRLETTDRLDFNYNVA